MIPNPDSLPPSSDLYGLDESQLKKQKKELDDERNDLIIDFQEILRK